MSKRRRNDSRGKKKKFNPIKTFFKIVCSMVMAFVILAGGAAFAYYKVTGEMPFADREIVRDASDMRLLDALLKRNMKMNVAVFGVDKEGTRTDVIFVVHYDSAKQSVNLVSLPRDTRVSMCSAVKARLDQSGRWYPAALKLNEVHAYAGKELGAQSAILQIEDLLGIKIDHYVKVDFEAFRQIVDAIGGVDVDVPQDMYWDMRDTGDPLINLKKGMQHLDGDKAEQLVRFRRYTDGDVGRIQVQQQFLKALMQKVMSTESILKNLPDYISVLYKYVETDVSMADALKYVNYISRVDMSKMTMETMPGAGQYVGGVSYYIHDGEKTREMVDRVFFNAAAVPAEGGTADSKGLLIEVSNGGTVNGLAGKFSDKLKQEGYRMASATTYTGQQVNYTRIQVKKEGVGGDLVQYFRDAKVEVAPSAISGDADIRIILGTNER